MAGLKEHEKDMSLGVSDGWRLGLAGGQSTVRGAQRVGGCARAEAAARRGAGAGGDARGEAIPRSQGALRGVARPQPPVAPRAHRAALRVPRGRARWCGWNGAKEVLCAAPAPTGGAE